MTLLVTGGGGFVMSNLVRLWLESDPRARAVALDAAPLDDLAERYFAAVRDRLVFIEADVRDPAAWADRAAAEGVTRIVHGATITPIAWTGGDGVRHDPERDDPRRVLDVNIGGTTAALEVARSLPGFERFIYVSSGSVYADEGPSPLPEDGWVDPDTLYPVSKRASELITARYGDLFDLPVVSVRFSSVYGPMDRVTPARHYACAANRIAHIARARRPVRVNAPEARDDSIYAPDVAEALVRMLRASSLAHPVYNIAYGEALSLAELAGAAGAAIETAPEDRCDIIGDPTRGGGRFGAYDISRLADELGWRPRPIADAMRAYVDWIGEWEEG